MGTWLKRTHTCGELRGTDVGRTAILNGWVGARRDMGGVIFIDLRDRYGRTQVVVKSEQSAALHAAAEALRAEFVIAVQGTVAARTPETVNPKLATGAVEVIAEKIEILNEAKPPPFEISEFSEASEEIRLKSRFVDLRRPAMQKNLMLRSELIRTLREYFAENRFVDVETPLLVRYTPGGARNFLVPSRIFPGSVYALPESPQIYKQLLMVAGMDRYVQIVKCLRDEDLRADRQPEFTQLDVEMSFVDEGDVLAMLEGAVARVFQRCIHMAVKTPFPRLTFAEAMETYGSDKPDTRFGAKLVEATEQVRGCGFKVFSDVVAAGGVVKGLRAPGLAKYVRKEIDALTTFVQGFGAKGLMWFKAEGGTLASSTAKFFKPEELAAIRTRFEAADGDLILLMAGPRGQINPWLGALRNHLAAKEKWTKPGTFDLLWVVDFPLFEYSEEEKALVARHHPFTSPKAEDVPKLDTAPQEVRARAYDLVLNGNELGGGSIRIHRRDVQKKIFTLLGVSDEEAREKFQFLLDAFEYGAPPHGGIALGIDRFAMLLLGLDNIRDVIAFPKTAKAQCLMTNAPSPGSEKQWKELHLRPVETPPAPQAKPPGA